MPPKEEQEARWVVRDGVPGWENEGRWAPVIAGGASEGGEGGNGGEGGAGGAGEGAGGDEGGGEGGKAPTAEDVANLTKALEAERDARRKAERKASDVKREADKARKDLEAAQQGGKSETEQLMQKLADLEAKQGAAEQRARDLTTDQAIAAAARAAGAIDPDAMPRLVDRAELDLDDDGKPSNAAAVIAALKRSKPQWFGEGGSGSFDQGRRGGSGTDAPKMDDLLRSAAKGR